MWWNVCDGHSFVLLFRFRWNSQCHSSVIKFLGDRQVCSVHGDNLLTLKGYLERLQVAEERKRSVSQRIE